MSSRNLGLAALTILFLASTGFGIYQTRVVSNQFSQLRLQKEEITRLNGRDVKCSSLEKENIYLLDIISQVRDSMYDAQSKVTTLQSKLVQSGRIIQTLKMVLEKMKADYNAVSNKLKALEQNENTSQGAIRQLEEEKANLAASLQQLNSKIINETQEAAEKEADVVQMKLSEARSSRINQLVTGTKVNYQRIWLSKEKNGKPITRTRKDNWGFTYLLFDLENSDKESVLDQYFIIKLVDSDSKEVLSYLESNPRYPESNIDSKGVRFKYEGNVIEVPYLNSQLKNGTNYEVQIWYQHDDGKEYLMPGSIYRFVMDGKVKGI